MVVGVPRAVFSSPGTSTTAAGLQIETRTVACVQKLLCSFPLSHSFSLSFPLLEKASIDGQLPMQGFTISLLLNISRISMSEAVQNAGTGNWSPVSPFRGLKLYSRSGRQIHSDPQNETLCEKMTLNLCFVGILGQQVKHSIS